MEPRALLHFKIFFIAAFIISGCSQIDNNRQQESTGYIHVTTGDVMLARISGTQYYNSLLLSGKIIELFPNGDTAKVTEYLEGKENGRQLIFYTGGLIKEESCFVNGKKEGEHKSWWENGKMKFIINFKNDEFDGCFKGWNESGFLFRVFNYKNGQEDGLQKAWFPDGRLQMNYVVKNNRKYGLTGVKNCQTENEK